MQTDEAMASPINKKNLIASPIIRKHNKNWIPSIVFKCKALLPDRFSFGIDHPLLEEKRRSMDGHFKDSSVDALAAYSVVSSIPG